MAILARVRACALLLLILAPAPPSQAQSGNSTSATAERVSPSQAQSGNSASAAAESAPPNQAQSGDSVSAAAASAPSSPVRAAESAGGAPAARRGVKVLIVNLFALEAAPWIEALRPTEEVRVPGLSSSYPTVKCTVQAVCQMTTGMGHANAAASVMAVLYSGLFDLREAYVLVAGIAGIDPERGTIGSAAWARYVVDSGIAHEIDSRELPKSWQDGYFGVLTDAPDQVPKFEYHTEVYRLDEALLQKALSLSRSVALEDSPALREYRPHYPRAPANLPPTVIQCDTLSDDTWWSGRRLGEHARRWTRLLTDGKGVYCTSQQEDNAVLNALTRGSQSGLVDLKRIAVLRSGSDFDRPYPHQGVLESLQAQRALPGAVTIAAVNLVRAGMPLVESIVRQWALWQHGVPAAAAP
jgi:purine nucleoside permease